MWSKLALLCGFAACATPAAPAGPRPAAVSSTTTAAGGYDAALARRLDADEYGMHKYVIAFLRRGPTRDLPKADAARLMKAHLANIVRLARQGHLVVAGPFLDDGPLRGIYIFKVETIEEARALTATDPAIEAGSLEMELHPWYGSAALQQLPALHDRIQRTSIAE